MGWYIVPGAVEESAKTTEMELVVADSGSSGTGD
jgi:hypothetical protein